MSSLTASQLYSYFLDGVPTVMGGALMWTGIRCLWNARALAEIFGIPGATKDEVVFFQSSTGRNISAALFIWTMIYQHERRIVGIFLLCWLSAGISDTKLLYEHPKGMRLGMHIRNTLMLAVMGTLLIYS